MFALLTAMSKAGELQRIASPKQAGSPAVERARLLQHSIGNQATIQLLTQGASITTGDAGSHDSPDSEPKKTRIEIGPVDDQQEREAHRVAEQVLRMPAGETARSSAPLEIGRKCSDCEEAEPEARARRTSVPVIVEDVLRSSGRPLDAATRSIFEQRFGRDFGAVRVHADAVAAQSAAAVDARAYTVGRHIVLGRETDGSQSGIGGRLLAHELTHTIQQASQPTGAALGSATLQRVPAGGAASEPQGQPPHEAKLPWYQSQQIDALEDRTKDWTEEERSIARTLLRNWFALRNSGRDPASVKKLIQEQLLLQYQRWLQAEDEAIQKHCRENDLGPRERFGGGISCEPLFEGERQLGYEQIRFMKSYQDQSSPDVSEPPLNTVHVWVREYRNRTNPEKLREAGLILGALQGFAFAVGTPGGVPVEPTGPPLQAPGARPSRALPPGSPAPERVGDIVSPGAETGLGPQRVVATTPGGDLVMNPVIRQPAPARALPEPAQSEGAAVAPAPPVQRQLPAGQPAPRGQRRYVPSPPPQTRPSPSTSPPPAAGVSPQPQLPKGTYPEGYSGNKTPTRVKQDPVTARPTGSSSTRDVDILEQHGMRRQDIAYRSGDQHHVFPQELQKWFEERFQGSEDIHEYTVYLSEGEHQAVHLTAKGAEVGATKEPDLLGWNQEWKNFKAQHEEASAHEIFEEAGRLMDKYRISAAEIRRYRQKKK